ncbi:unnamed protein product, partial [Amoebophrya sp. A25]
PKSALDSKWCSTSTCSTTRDLGTCCDWRPLCKNSKNDACGSGSGYQVRSDRQNSRCQAATCTTGNDRSLCCQQKCTTAMCSHADWIPKSDIGSRYCKASECKVGDDRATCCDERAQCKDSKDNACGSSNSYQLRDDRLNYRCVGKTCTTGNDLETCCQHMCTDAMCASEAMTKKASFSSLWCKTAEYNDGRTSVHHFRCSDGK